MELRRSKRHLKRFMVNEGRRINLLDEHKFVSTEALADSLNFPLLELPLHLIYDILSRLPLSNIIQCRCISKMFLKLLKDPYFSQIHLARAPLSTTNLILQENSRQWGALHFFTFDLREAALSSCSSDDQNTISYYPHGLHKLSELDAEFSFHTQRLTLVGSCNGLLCLYFDTYSKHVYVICNPMLGEYIKLPKLSTLSSIYTYAKHSGFGYCPRTKQYKVVSFMYLASVDPQTLEYSRKMVAEIHTLGSGRWRRIENVPMPKRESFDPFFNGALHWITQSSKPSELLSSFDLETEEFRFIQPPAHFNALYVNKLSWINIGVLRDYLCICYIYEDTKFEVWVMREYGVKESWTKDFSIDLKFYCKLRVEDLHRPVKFLSNGDLWFISSSDSLVCFSPRKRTFRELRSVGLKRTRVSIHDLSFLSLKDVQGANNLKVKKFTNGRRRFIFGI